MANETKGGVLPLIAGGVLMVVCCAGPVIFGTAAIASISAWFGGWSIGETTALAGLGALVAYGVLRLRKSRADADGDAQSDIIENGDKNPQ